MYEPAAVESRVANILYVVAVLSVEAALARDVLVRSFFEFCLFLFPVLFHLPSSFFVVFFFFFFFFFFFVFFFFCCCNNSQKGPPSELVFVKLTL
jgi:hypothetical protein